MLGPFVRHHLNWWQWQSVSFISTLISFGCSTLVQIYIAIQVNCIWCIYKSAIASLDDHSNLSVGTMAVVVGSLWPVKRGRLDVEQVPRLRGWVHLGRPLPGGRPGQKLPLPQSWLQLPRWRRSWKWAALLHLSVQISLISDKCNIRYKTFLVRHLVW